MNDLVVLFAIVFLATAVPILAVATALTGPGLTPRRLVGAIRPRRGRARPATQPTAARASRAGSAASDRPQPARPASPSLDGINP